MFFPSEFLIEISQILSCTSSDMFLMWSLLYGYIKFLSFIWLRTCYAIEVLVKHAHITLNFITDNKFALWYVRSAHEALVCRLVMF